jgi:hypothetical protein
MRANSRILLVTLGSSVFAMKNELIVVAPDRPRRRDNDWTDRTWKSK